MVGLTLWVLWSMFCRVAMALGMITRRLESKLQPMFCSASLLHSHATSFGISSSCYRLNSFDC